MDPVPDLLRRARAAREGLAHLLQPRRQRRRARQQRADRRDPAAARRARRGCSATRTTPPGGSRTAWPRRRERAMALLEAVWPAALARVEQEVADMQAIADAEGAGIKIEPWDYRYYAEKVRQAKYDLDSDEVKQYLQLDKLREAMFFVAGELFDFEFTPLARGHRSGLPPRREGLGGHRTGHPASTSACGTSIPSRAPASARAPGPRPTAATRPSTAADDARLQQLELHQGRAGRAGADLLGRRRDALPRVRPRAALAVVEGRLPDAERRRARLHRVPVAAARALAARPTR